MGCRTYSAGELLRLRRAAPKGGVAEALAAKVEEDADLGEIIRSGPSRPLSLTAGEDSNASSEADDRCHRAAAQQLDGTDSERKFRGRTDSEHERGPMTAPADLAAQKAEGFQKFCNSVVSPTHVRVTAGGRIVPNTRGTHSPTMKWARERNPADGPSNARSVSGYQPEGIPYPILPPGWAHFTPMVPAHAPGTVPGLAFRPDAFPPMAYNIASAYGIQAVQFAPVPSQQPAVVGAPQMAKQNEITASDQPKAIQFAPPEQFNPNQLQFNAPQPVLCNGQWLIAHGPNLYPLTLMPPSGPPQLSSLPPSNADFNAPALKPDQPSGLAQLPAHNLLTATDAASRLSDTPSPPISSIRPSSITKKQLEVLRSQKKYHEDQIQFNKHQIDHKNMGERLETICREIKHFEQILANQLNFEARKYPKVETQKDHRVSHSSIDYAHSDAGLESSVTARAALPAAIKGQTTRERVQVRSVTVHNPSNAVTTFQPAKEPAHVHRSDRADYEFQRKPSSLPVNAALAPPFQPRTDVSNSSLATGVPEEPVSAKHSHFITKSSAHWQSFFKKAEAAKNYGTPYLIGKLPAGIDPASARDTDYTYCRELTEDEHRARHMFWGKAPHHLQEGLPKYDGKHFYPASPIKDSTVDTVESTMSTQGPANTINVLTEPKTMSTKTGENDPFHAMAQAGMSAIRNRFDDATRSESLHRAEDSLRGSSASELPHSESYVSQPSPRYLEFRRIVNERTRISSENLRAKMSEDSGDEEGSLIFKGRRTMERTASSRYPNEIWSTMRKKGKASANVIASKVSPMTAQGVLPNYAGYATASLTPTIANTTPGPRNSGNRLGDASDITPTNIAAERRRENRPPLDLLNQQLRSVSFQDKNHHDFSTH
ncbi:hypothetical protein FDECE_12886 [Fusarium decemcellulare]|nr:hypothetical protein FDECE_12886 [Fusarium decemcellulare]